MTAIPLTDQINQWARDHVSELVDVLSELIALPSENRAPGGTELAFQHRFAELLADVGMTVHMFTPPEIEGLTDHSLYWPGRDYTDRPNVVGALAGTGSGRSLLLGGHGDVVIGLSGDHDPFTPQIEGDKLYGRGSNDMKGGLVAAVFALRCLRDLGVRLAGDVFIESDVDEEMGGSNGNLAARLAGYNPDAAIVMEPSELVIAPSHFGGRVYRITIGGKGGMGFGGEEVINPIYGMARLVRSIEDLAEKRATQPAPSPELDPGRGLETVVSIVQAAEFEPGTGDGVPREALIEVWVESWPGTTAEELDDEFLGHCREFALKDPVLSRCEIRYDYVTRHLRGSSIPVDSDIVVATAAATAATLGAERSVVRAAPFACDVFVMHDFGIPALVLGPCGGNAHSADEFVSIESLRDLVAVLAQTTADWCGVSEEKSNAVGR